MAMQSCPACKGTGEVEINILKLLRERTFPGVGQAPIAVGLGITQSAYSRLEARGGAPGGIEGSKHLRALADIFKVTTDQLIGRAPLAGPKTPRPARPADPASLAKSAQAKKEKAAKNRRRRG